MSEVSDAIGKAMHSDDPRPANCTMRLREEGKAAPKSGCPVCRNGGMLGCPYHGSRPSDRPPGKPDLKAIADDVRASVKALNDSSRRAHAAGLKVSLSTMNIQQLNESNGMPIITVDISLKL